MNRQCIVCGYHQHRVIFVEFGIDILRCRRCRHVFSSYQVDQYYAGYFGDSVKSKDHFWSDQAKAQMYSDFCDRFIAGNSGRLLDVGCGLGYFVKTVSAFPGWQVTGYEVSSAAVGFAQDELGLDNVLCGKVEESNLPKGSFDVITLWDVIEHVPNPDPLLSYLCSILKGDGILFIHTPNVAIQLPKARITRRLMGMDPRMHYLEARDHVNLYSMNTIRIVLGRNGFNEIRFVHLHPIQSLAGSKNRLLKLVKNGVFHISRISFALSFGRMNIDNLFVVARK